MTKGFMMFAYNNEQIDYTKLAIVATSALKKYMPDIPVVLVTNERSLIQSKQYTTKKMTTKLWDQVIMTDPEYETNIRIHNDGAYNSFNAQFTNTNKHDIYNLTPFD